MQSRSINKYTFVLGMHRTSAGSRPAGAAASVCLSVRLLSVCLCVLCLCIGASGSPHDTFRYQLLSSRRAESCTLCFGHACGPLEDARCRYYADADDALGRGEDVPAPASEVDTLVADMVALASDAWVAQECIPLISEYTNCNKENICVGCAVCACDAHGRWMCRREQRCRAPPPRQVDHAVLRAVANALRDIKTLRKKRSTLEDTTEGTIISYDEISAWLFGINPKVIMNEDFDRDQTTVNATESTRNTVGIQPDYEYVAFDEVLKNIEIDSQTFKRRKPDLKDIADYMNMEDINIVKNNNSDEYFNMLNAMLDEEDTRSDMKLNESTKIVVDLLSSLNQYESNNLSDYQDVNNNLITAENDDELNEAIKPNAINIMKRDVSSAVKSNIIITTTTQTPTTSRKSITALENNVLIPLTKVINDKQQELKDLSKIKQNLLKFITDNKDIDFDFNLENKTELNATNTILSIYNVDMDVYPEIQSDLRNMNTNVMDKLLYKLKRDIYEVIRDVVGIKKISRTNDLPEDLKNLIRAMSIFIRKQSQEANAKKRHEGIDTSARRHFENFGVGYLNTTKDYLIAILEIIDNNMPQPEVLSYLSQNIRKIIKRVVNNNYVYDFMGFGFKLHDPEYNLMTHLKNVGRNWQDMLENIDTSAPADKIYAMKLLHIAFSSDISKLNEALTLIDFVQTRRMTPIDGLAAEEFLKKINRELIGIYENVQILANYQQKKSIAKVNKIAKRNHKKSFFDKLKTLLKGSKLDIVEIVDKKVPRSYKAKSVKNKQKDKQLEKNKFDYETIVRKWEQAFNVIPRNKRSADKNKMKNRMKNIIPKYLRGKLDPAISSKKSKKIKKMKKKATKKSSTTVKASKVEE